MEIAGAVKCSFIDYPGRIAAVLFTPGCNLRCFFCHNEGIIRRTNVMRVLTPQEVIRWLETRIGLLDAVVISGGEPTLQPDLEEFMSEIRSLGYLMKLDTNGTRPNVLTSVMNRGLVDYVAMDIKAPAEKYDAICRVSVDQGAITESISLLMEGCIDYELRTTVIPQLTPEDILSIGNRILGARTYVLQGWREFPSDGFLNDSCRTAASWPPMWLKDVQNILGHMVKNCFVRGFERNTIQAK